MVAFQKEEDEGNLRQRKDSYTKRSERAQLVSEKNPNDLVGRDHNKKYDLLIKVIQ